MSNQNRNNPDISNSIFALQHSTNKLTAWVPLINQVVIIAYPTSQGKRIAPTAILQWMQRRDLAWVCACALIGEGVIQSCRIVTSASDGVVYAFCVHLPNKCNFIFNISKAFLYATYKSEYASYPATVSSTIPDIEGLRRHFIDYKYQVLPYFQGYFGKRASMHRKLDVQENFKVDWMQGMENVFSSRNPEQGRVHPMRDNIVVDWTANPPGVQRSLLGAPPVVQQIVTLGPEASEIRHQIKASLSLSRSLPQEPPIVLSVEQYNLLATLGCGEGITFTERDYLFETCHGCSLVFVMSTIRRHAVFCCRRRG